MAEVYLAKVLGAAGFERFVAVKRILPEMAADDAFVSMFLDEARIAAHLKHPNIVEIHELGRHLATYFLSMEYVSGRDLRAVFEVGRAGGPKLPLDLACWVGSRIADALDYAHKKRDGSGAPLGIVHRDVTPQNVLLSYDGSVKLCDFGIAKASTRASMTQVGVLKGKFAYMAPEQIRQLPTDGRSDQFSLGVLLHELLSKERLFLRDNDYLTLEAVRIGPIPSLAPRVGQELDAVVRRMLARNPDDRFSDAKEARDALLAVFGQPSDPARELAAFMAAAFPGAEHRERSMLDRYAQLRPSAETLAQVERTELTPHPLLAPEPQPIDVVRDDEDDKTVALRTATPGPALAPVGLEAPLVEPTAAASGTEITGRRSHLHAGFILLALGISFGFGALLWWGQSPALEVVPDPPAVLEVSVDGRLVGRGAIVVHRLEPGLHVVEVRAAGYRPYTQTVRIGRSGRHTMRVGLEPER